MANRTLDGHSEVGLVGLARRTRRSGEAEGWVQRQKFVLSDRPKRRFIMILHGQRLLALYLVTLWYPCPKTISLFVILAQLINSFIRSPLPFPLSHGDSTIEKLVDQMRSTSYSDSKHVLIKDIFSINLLFLSLLFTNYVSQGIHPLTYIAQDKVSATSHSCNLVWERVQVVKLPPLF